MLLMCILALAHVRIWGFTPFIMIQIQCNVLCNAHWLVQNLDFLTQPSLEQKQIMRSVAVK